MKIVFVVAILVLLASDVFFAVKYNAEQNKSNETILALEKRQNSQKILDFTRLFIGKVLKNDKEIDFETRLQLENSVRDINDAEIFDQWNKFIASKEEKTAQKEVVNLLDMLLVKIN